MQHAAPPLLTGTPRALDASEFDAVARSCGNRRHACVVLDARGAREGRIPCSSVPGSAWLPFDAQGRPPVFLMPARGRAIVVIGENAAAVASLCTELGWPAWWFEGEVDARWLQPGPPVGALWDIDPHLRAHLDRLPAPGQGPVLDLGSGSSREGVFLAQSGYRVLAVDRLPDALDLAHQRGAHHGVSIETLVRRVIHGDDLPPGPFAAVLLLRFLERGVLPGLKRVMAPGGWVLLRTFGRLDQGSRLPAASSAAPASAPGGPRRAARRIAPEEVAPLLGPGWDCVDGPRTEAAGGAVWTVVAARWEGQ